MRGGVLAVLALLVAAAAAAAGGGISKLTGPADWAQVGASNEVWAVEFMSPRCGTCLEVRGGFPAGCKQGSGGNL